MMPRACALDLLDAVSTRKQPLIEAIDGHPGLSRLSARDRALAHNLAATVLRRRGQIDGLIDHCLDRPLSRKARDVRNFLRLGAGQILFLKIPLHAAVDTTVALAQQRRHGAYKALINAVLRRLCREAFKMIEAQDAARLNTPDWLWESWQATYGEATCRAIAEAHLGEPPLDITVKNDPHAWADRLEATVLGTGTLRLHRRQPVTELAGYSAGAWWVQDAAAALPARLLGDVKGRRVIDLCAAPGGKTAQLIAAGARVTAIDRSPKRLGRLRANLNRLGMQAETITADAGGWRPQEAADAVLLDAPCSATGIIRRHPDVAWLKNSGDVAWLAVQQERLLDAAVAMVKPGGLVVYASCSLQPAEGRDRIAALLAGGGAVERVAIATDEIGGLAELLTTDGDLRSLPCHLAEAGGMDGFFAARLRRR
ncbi:MAG TPA: 16S rRNA (cytosine(967)-C(5))-methyltransferase RsmB [Rhodospirillales bacterium]|jgi:16S rRNA (cytosine967-C5)-methyltransferase|nr:16S rRNA (cytosine(967)-C(5))-methyltransferase RsmB [Rhodospirillales bacterium]